MKKIRLYFAMFAVAFGTLTSGCSKAQQASNSSDEEPVTPDSISNKKVLIVYLSRTNNTKAIAQMIQQEVGGTMVALELVNPYPENYQAIVAQVSRENETGFLPSLKTKIDSIVSYDVIFIGFPTWGMQLPPPMKSFLSQNDLRGKTIVPFNTNAGYGLGSTIQTVKELAPNSTILKEFSITGGIERDGVLFVMEGEKEKQAKEQIQTWLKSINLKE